MKYRFLIIFLSLALPFSLISEDVEEEVVVISSKYPVPLDEVVGSVATISQEDIEGRIVNNLGDLMEQTIGVSVNKTTSYGRTYNEGISIRGLGGKRVNIIVDGIRISDAYTGYGRDIVEMDLIKRVEILKGPSSALYGSDGLAGAVSYITKDASDLADPGNNYYSISTTYDEDSDQNKINFLGATVGQNIEALLQITSRDLSEGELHDDATLTANPLSADQSSVLGKLKLILSDSFEATITADFQEWEGDIELNSDETMSFYPVILNTSESVGVDEGTRERVSLKLDFLGESFFENGSINIFTQETEQEQQTTKSQQTFGNGLQAGPTELSSEFRNYQFNQSIDGFSAEFFKTIGSDDFGRTHNLVYGLEYESTDTQRPRIRVSTNLMTGAQNTFLGGEYYPNKTFPDTETKRKAFFINDRIEVDERTAVVFGARYDGYELNPKADALFEANNQTGYQLAEIDDSEVSLKLGFIRDLTEDVSFYAQYAEGFRSPDYESANLSFTNLAYYYMVRPNPNLESERSDGLEIGLKGSLGDTDWSLALYDNEYENFIDSTMVGTSQMGLMIFESQNLTDVNIKGLELEVKKEISENLSTSFGLSMAKGEENGEDLTSVDPDEAMVGLNWKSDSGKLNINSLITLVSEGPYNLPPSCNRSGVCTAQLELPGRAIYDVYMGYEITSNLTFRLAAKNLTDKKYWRWSSVRGKLSNDSSLDLFLEPGRNLSASLKYEF